MATWTPATRNTASFTNQSRSGAGLTYGDLTNDQIGDMSNDDILFGRPIGEWLNSDPVPANFWSTQSRKTAVFTNQTRN